MPGLPQGLQQAPMMSPQDEQSLISQVSRPFLSGLATLGAVLDTPGAIVRNTLTGANPLQGLFEPEKRATGRDVLGIENDPTKWEASDFLGFLAEVGLDPLTYLSFGGSALSKAGQVAKNAGLLDDMARLNRMAGKSSMAGPRLTRSTTKLMDVADSPMLQKQKLVDAANAAGVKGGFDEVMQQIGNQELGGFARIGLPFGGPGVNLTNPAIASGMDRVGAAIRFGHLPGLKDVGEWRKGNFQTTGVSPGKALARLFDRKSNEATSTVGQKIGAGVYADEGQAINAARSAGAEALSELRNSDYFKKFEAREAAAKAAGVAPPNMEMELREALEGVKPAPGLEGFVDVATKLFPQMKGAYQAIGMDIGELDDLAEYFPRFMTQLSNAGGKMKQVAAVTDDSARARLDFLRNIPGGTASIMRIAQDTDIEDMILQGVKPKEIADTIASKYASELTPTYKRYEDVLDKFKELEKQFPNETEDTLMALARDTAKESNRYQDMASWLKGLSPEIRQTGVFGNNPIIDLMSRVKSAEESVLIAHRVVDALADPDLMKFADNANFTGETVPLKHLLTGKWDPRIRKNKGGLGFKGSTKPDDVGGNVYKVLAERLGQDANNPEVLKQIAESKIPRELADDLMRMKEGFKSPEAVNDVIKAYDSFSNLFKGWVTMHPAFHSRNLVSGQFHNWVLGMFSLPSVKASYDMIRGKDVAALQEVPVVQRMLRQRKLPNTPKNATDMVRELAYANDLVSPAQGLAIADQGGVELARNLKTMQREFPGGVQGSEPFSYADTANKLLAREGSNTSWLRPSGMRGVGDQSVSTFAPAAASDDAGYLVESANRLSPFIHELQRGVDPTVAANKVKAAQIDYSGRTYTSTERAVVHRLFPFAKFSSRMVPQVLKEIAERPGGRLAQTIRGTNYARDDNSGIVPEYISQGLSIPLPSGPSGQPRYLTGLGLMHEDPASFIGRPQDVALELASRLNPLLKFPMEYAAGQSFYQRGPTGGRELEDLDPVVGRILANMTGAEDAIPTNQFAEHLLMNSPIARVLTSTRQITDNRKGMGAKAANLLTGLRISDVSPQAQEAILRERLGEALRNTPGARAFERIFVPKEVQAQMSPQELQQVQQIQQLLAELAKRAKERAQAREAQVNRAG